jgi:hypothetical protein
MANSSLKHAYTIAMANMKWLLMPLVGVLAVSWNVCRAVHVAGAAPFACFAHNSAVRLVHL